MIPHDPDAYLRSLQNCGRVFQLLFEAVVKSLQPIRNYVVTEQVVEISDTKIVLQKGKDRWEIARVGPTFLPPDIQWVLLQMSLT